MIFNAAVAELQSSSASDTQAIGTTEATPRRSALEIARPAVGSLPEAPASVLVIDDDPDISELIRLALEKVGYRVTTTADGAAGLSLVQRLKPDLVVLDFALPTLDGVTVLERMRQSNLETPVVMITAFGSPQVFRSSFRAGISVFLTKPLAIDVLVQRINSLLKDRA